MTDKTEGILLPGSVDGSTWESRAPYQHRQDPYSLSYLGNNLHTERKAVAFHDQPGCPIEVQIGDNNFVRREDKLSRVVLQLHMSKVLSEDTASFNIDDAFVSFLYPSRNGANTCCLFCFSDGSVNACRSSRPKKVFISTFPAQYIVLTICAE